MERLIKKYSDKLINQGICNPGTPLIGGLDADLIWNREAEETKILEEVVAGLNINSILFAKPAEPYNSIINYLAANSTNDGAIHPDDTESRTFLHDIPVAQNFNSEQIIKNLKRRKSVIIPNHGIVTFGTVSPEQAFITYSSVCFSTYVKFFTDYYYAVKGNDASVQKQKSIISSAADSYGKFINEFTSTPVIKGPLTDNETIIIAMAEAGRLTIESRMVDSFFGNISYKINDSIFISQTGSSMDELEGYIDKCSTDNHTTTAITASSEFSAHKNIFELTDKKAILHGHPKFSVIISMICDKIDCQNRGMCHIKCSSKRSIKDVPIVPGEVGTGPTGLVNTLPPALTGRGAIVFGHGLFTTGKIDYTDAFANLVNIEKTCFEEYIKIIS